jgi:uncharacterized protein YabE (DUF348 family)
LVGIGILVAALAAAWPVVAGSGMDVTVSVDGYEEAVRTSRSSVAQLLTDLGVRVRPEDRVTPGLDTPVTPGMAVTVRRARLGAVEADGTTFTAYTHAGDAWAAGAAQLSAGPGVGWSRAAAGAPQRAARGAVGRR